MGKITQIVFKNTSTIDYTLPLLWDLKKSDPNHEIQLIYCVLSKKQILRNSTFISKTLNDVGGKELDLSDFIKPTYRGLYRMLAHLFEAPEADKQNSADIKYTQSKNPFHILKMLLSYSKMFVSRKLQQLIINNFVDFNAFIEACDSDVVLFDNRSRTNLPGVQRIYDLLEKNKTPTVLLPHAPHYISEFECYMPYEPNGRAITDYCDVWLPLHFAKKAENDPAKDSQISRIGYPAFDKKWRLHLMGSQQKDPKVVNCLYIGRKFLDKGTKKPDVFDPFTLEYEEVLHDFSLMKEAFANSSHEIKLIVKPHPSSNFEMLAELIQEAGIINFEITQEIFYGVLPQIDFCISPFSTSILLPALSGIPTIVFNSELQDFVHQKWNVLEKLYTNMELYLNNNEDLSAYVKKAIEKGQNNNFENEEDLQDFSILREYYPDNALQKGRERILELMEK